MSSSQRRFADVKFGSVRVARRRRLWGALTVGLPTLLAIVGGALEPRTFPGGTLIEPGSAYPGWWRIALMVGFFASLASVILWTIYNGMGAAPASGKVSLVITDDELVVFEQGEPKTFARSSIVNVFTHRQSVGVTLEDGRTLSFATADEATRREIREALDPDPGKARSVLPIGGPARAFTAVGMVGWWIYIVMLPIFVSTAGATSDALASHSSTRLVPYFAAIATIVAGLWLSLKRREVVVGTDGVRLKGTLFDTFVPHASIERVTHFSDDKVIVHHSGGRKLRLPPAPGNSSLKDRIDTARKLPRGEAPPVEGLARGDRSEHDWRRALAALAEDRSYRAGALRIEDVEATLVDPGAQPEARVGAAMALRDRSDGPERIRVAVETTADADLQAALEAAAEGEVAGSALRKAQRRFDARRKPSG